MVTRRRELRGERDGEEREKDERARRVTELQRHREGVTARLAARAGRAGGAPVNSGEVHPPGS